MIEQLTTLIRSLTISQRIGILFGAAMSVMLMVGLVLWAGQPQMVPAFTGLDAKTAGEISAALDSAGIPYELKGTGGIIMVPSNQLAEAKIAASTDAGYSDGQAPGWDSFDTMSFGQTEAQQAIAEQRAVQGDLQNKIEGIQGVAEASVTVVPEDTGTLVSEDNLASAAVWVRMQGGGQPGNEIVNGIVSMTAAAVKGLVPANVTVVDSQGTTLAGPGTTASAAATIQNTTEREMEAKIHDLLYPVLGANNSRVAVTASLDLDKVARKVTEYTADKNTPTSAQQSWEVVNGDGTAGVSGIPGTTSNVAGITYPNASPLVSPDPNASPGTYDKGSITVNWANTQTVADIIQTPGAVKGLSVAVMANQEAVTAAGISQEQLETQIAAAIGAVDYNGKADPQGTRQDQIKVLPVKFLPPAEVPAPLELPTAITSFVPTILGLLLGVLMLFLVWRNMSSLKTRAEDMQLVAARVGSPGTELEFAL